MYTILDFVFFVFFCSSYRYALESHCRATSLAPRSGNEHSIEAQYSECNRRHPEASRSIQSTIGSMWKTHRKVVEPVLSQTWLRAYFQNTWIALDIDL